MMAKMGPLPTIKEGKTGTKMRTKFQAPISKGENVKSIKSDFFSHRPAKRLKLKDETQAKKLNLW